MKLRNSGKIQIMKWWNGDEIVKRYKAMMKFLTKWWNDKAMIMIKKGNNGNEIKKKSLL
jgi:hypothetical protein